MATATQSKTKVNTGSSSGSNGGSKKKVCPITRQQFRDSAKPVTVKIGDVPMAAAVKEFSTDSIGWYLNGKTVIEVDGTPCEVQVGLNLTIVGSKELPK